MFSPAFVILVHSTRYNSIND